MRDFLEIGDLFPEEIKSKNYILYKKTIQYDNGLTKDLVILRDTFEDKVMMSNDEADVITCKDFLDNAYGDVLILGLGIGFVVFPLLEDSQVKSIDIVEIDEGVIEMVSPILKNKDIHNKVTIIQDSAFDYHNKDNKKKYDTIWIDIWEDVRENEMKEAEKLMSDYKKLLKDGGYMDFWTLEKFRTKYGIQ